MQLLVPKHPPLGRRSKRTLFGRSVELARSGYGCRTDAAAA